ncbi:MAG TPA: response regulator [Bryobacteraceae bacterium]|jgi:PAS domain S-box-containing protein
MPERVSVREGRILVVDDDPEALTLLVGVLEGEGYQVQPADSGRLALISVAADPPDLILLDIRMPGMDGFEVCRRIKETEQGVRIPLIFISAVSHVEEWVGGLTLGAVDFVSKPFRREELLARVRTHLELGRLRAELESLVAQRTAELRFAIDQLQLEVADRRRAEQAARESELRFRQIADTAPVIIWQSDETGALTFFNKSAVELSGRNVEDLLGLGLIESVHPEDRAQFQAAFIEAVAARGRFQSEFRLRDAGGGYRSVLATGTPRYVDLRFEGHIGTLTDVTDLRRSFEQMFAAQGLENLRVLTAGIAHDFNTLMAAIYGETDLALSEMAEGGDGRDSVERIRDIAKRAAGIVRLLMTYAGDRSVTAAPEPLNLSALVGDLAPLLKLSISKRADLRTELAAQLPSIRGNASQMRQVILNLVINASEALEQAMGAITIRTGHATIDGHQPDGMRGRLPLGSYVRIEVSDTGCGMNEEVRARIFDPYYTTKSLGKGLGLAVVQGIIRAHGGGIAVRSAPRQGSTFEILLPVDC